MRKYYWSVCITLLILLANLSFAQGNNASKIIEEVSKKFDKIKDYSVEAKIKVDIEFLKVPDRNAKIYFKKPDKVKMKSDGFALLPKQGMNFSPTVFLTDKYESIYIRNEKINNVSYDVIKVIPLSDTSSILLSTLWIDSKNLVIKKVNTLTKKTGMLEVEFKYDKGLIKYSLPNEVKFTFNPEEESEKESKSNKSNSSKTISRNMKGSVVVYYSNYKINSGIPDSVFDTK